MLKLAPLIKNMNEIIYNIILQVIYYVLVVYLFGFIIALVNKTFYKLFNYNKGVIYGTGLIGTPIHETAHALLCLVFFHKIEEVKFFQVSDDGVLGYVNHSYNKKNLYQVMGNYFIGVAPLFVGAIIILILTSLFIPNSYNSIEDSIIAFSANSEFSLSIIKDLFLLSISIIKAVFTGGDKFLFIMIYLLLIMMIALHMNLSNADLKGSIGGVFLFIFSMVLLRFDDDIFGRWTEEGRVFYLKWRNFKDFIEDYSLIKEHPPESIAIWKKYLIYGAALGVADEVYESMKLEVPNISEYDDGIFMYHYYGGYSLMNSAFETGQTAANPSSDSGSFGGFGGGSGGGGGGAF